MNDKYVIPMQVTVQLVYGAGPGVTIVDKPSWVKSVEVELVKDSGVYSGQDNAETQNRKIREFINAPSEEALEAVKSANDGKGWDRLTDRYNKNVALVGVNSAEEHYFRNKLNRVPETLTDLLNEKEKWELMESYGSMYHMNGAGEEFNLKFVSKDGKYEAVFKPKDAARVSRAAYLKERIKSATSPFNGDGNANADYLDQNARTRLQNELRSVQNYLANPINWELVKNQLNMGTFNYANPKDNFDIHNKLDVDTYTLYGNIDKSLESGSEFFLFSYGKYLDSEMAQKNHQFYKNMMK